MSPRDRSVPQGGSPQASRLFRPRPRPYPLLRLHLAPFPSLTDRQRSLAGTARLPSRRRNGYGSRAYPSAESGTGWPRAAFISPPSPQKRVRPAASVPPGAHAETGTAGPGTKADRPAIEQTFTQKRVRKSLFFRGTQKRVRCFRPAVERPTTARRPQKRVRGQALELPGSMRRNGYGPLRPRSMRLDRRNGQGAESGTLVAVSMVSRGIRMRAPAFDMAYVYIYLAHASSVFAPFRYRRIGYASLVPDARHRTQK